MTWQGQLIILTLVIVGLIGGLVGVIGTAARINNQRARMGQGLWAADASTMLDYQTYRR